MDDGGEALRPVVTAIGVEPQDEEAPAQPHRHVRRQHPAQRRDAQLRAQRLRRDVRRHDDAAVEQLDSEVSWAPLLVRLQREDAVNVTAWLT